MSQKRPFDEGPLLSPPSTPFEKKKKTKDEFKKIVEILEEDEKLICTSEIHHNYKADFKLEKITKSDQTPTPYVICRSQFCTNAEYKHKVFFGIRGNLAKANHATDYYVKRHIQEHHHSTATDAEELEEIAAEVVANDGLSIGAFETETMKKFCARAHQAIANGISSHKIVKILRRKSTVSNGIVKSKLPGLIQENRCCLVLDGFDCPRLTKERSSKYLGVFIGFYDSNLRKTRFFLLHYGVIFKATDANVRRQLENVLSDWNILDFFHAKRLPVVGDAPMAQAFSDYFAVVCASHTISNQLKRYITLVQSDAIVGDSCVEIEKAVSACNHRAERDDCSEKSFNDLVKSYTPTEDELKHIRQFYPNYDKFVTIDRIYYIRFRSFITTYKQLMANEPLLRRHQKYLTDSKSITHEIDWKLVHYLYSVSQVFEPALASTDSDHFSVGDTLAKLFDLLKFLLQVDPADFKEIHQELILTVADYIFGANITGRKPSRGSYIKSRANPAALVGLSLDFFSRHFEFTLIRNRLDDAFEKDSFITQSTYNTLNTCFDTAVPVWKETVRKTFFDLAEQTKPSEEIFILVPVENQQQTTPSAATSSQPKTLTPPSSQERAPPTPPSSQAKSTFEEEMEQYSSDEDECEKSSTDEFSAWFKKENKTERKESVKRYKQWLNQLDPQFKTSASTAERSLMYFTHHAGTYPTFARIAQLVRSTPGSSGSIERLFSKANDIMSSKRNCLNTSTVELILQVSSYPNVQNLFE
ncbi:Oidioi.mRNA.OKI2018_I69.chr1.g37.t1.cds [Oikopleura dioica]|uniref:Oidioi.mRNA.OKI2018_I69.chr1.g34.t1.cds n=1 Tax=Oikopleura dioica TaxID=34765 RepID=A0ABN7SNP4_OIKDI|nr:Oidioi.mRNA.OKI2018_I69.chr1.g34.t1.cds [Oikopleura dioica]CAG5101865.1 Oidioi.mRNA.OKI2018_I69.chr1.g37.t1.cds [Oikopleura dioica]